ncbi:LuxR C-terminal-related transcriptional regulator [Serratia sp. Tan611]|uniref:helix-turn-helix transcriptional regulator n=1 Tax=Serratia sp. Tan611 TaxID=2773264 RepID=UPI001933B461|nr:LuxR C-terminal-related transcriptional regulator [Serratia sp. Tan611]MBU3895534.1 LuxR C-terminal-related transcriptional regulator [Serratia rubidaea]CAE1147663.1 HTH luxR-type domain-containing protein [Serratia sp. Tan611]
MTRTLSIYIDDSNLFFATGLRLALEQHFSARSVGVCHLYSTASPADLVIIAAGEGVAGQFCRLPRPDYRLSTAYLTLRDRPEVPMLMLPACQRETGRLYRRDPLEKIMRQVDAALEACEMRYDFAHRCYWCDKHALTLREHDIVRRLGRGETPYDIAERLQISVKTVSLYKRSMMRKMHLKSTSDLYHWLQNGGLKHQPVA